MERSRNEKFVVFITSIAGLGLALETVLMDWEWWAIPLIAAGTIALWIMNLREKPDVNTRVVCFYLYAMLTFFFHGVHETGFFDVSIVATLGLVVYSFLYKKYVIHLLFTEYFLIMFIQFYFAITAKNIVFDTLAVSRLVLHVAIVVVIYFCCLRKITDRLSKERSEEEKDIRLESYETDMEDFLSNISHELRTPVNVVNGMSDLLLKRDVGYEADAIKRAGIRLASQIEDIQDYTECKRGKILLEEEDYMTTSLITDVVMSFRRGENERELELVVDLDPRVPAMLRGDIKKIRKIFRHLLENAQKFTYKGGILVRMYSEKTDYGVNLCIEITDTGIGMDRKTIESVSEGMYQANKKRNRNSGGIGLGLFIVYGFAHRMGGFVKIESRKNSGSTIRVTLPQKVVNDAACLEVTGGVKGDLLFHVRSNKYKVPAVREFYRTMAVNLATGIHASLYAAETISDIERLQKKLNVRYIFMGQEEYEDNPKFFDEVSKGNIVVGVSALPGFKPNPGSRVMIMPKPLYAYPVIKILNEGLEAKNIESPVTNIRPVFRGIRALVVDDEPMNLVVASGLFRDYEMIVDTAGSGKEAILKFQVNDYDVIFMDHMMPEMDGVEAMHILKKMSVELHKKAVVVALTANVVSGAKEMFMQEGFDGFISKPIYIPDFERTMLKVLPGFVNEQEGGKAE
jgi:signal transduction histidine kinase